MEQRRLLLNPSSGLGRFLQIPQDLIDDGWMRRLKPTTVVIFLFIYRKIIGWHKTSDSISYSQIKRYTGAANDTIGEALKSLEELGWITRQLSSGHTTRITLHLRNYLTQDEIRGVTDLDESEFSVDLVEDTSPEIGEVPLQKSSTTSPEILHLPLQKSSIQNTKGKTEEQIHDMQRQVESSSEPLPFRSLTMVKPEFTIKSMSGDDEEDVPKEVFSSASSDKVKRFWDKVNGKIARREPLGTNELLAVFADLYRSRHGGSKYVIQPKHRSKIKILVESLSAQEVLLAMKYYSDHESEYPGGVMSVDVFVGWINSIKSAMDGVVSKPTLESRRDVERKGGVGEW